jgi:hypothetical protein
LPIYLLGVRLFDVWFEGIWLLEIVDKVTEVEVFRREALVVSDVGDLRHVDMWSQWVVGRIVLEFL